MPILFLIDNSRLLDWNHWYIVDSNVYSERPEFFRRSFEWYRKVLSSNGKKHYYSIYPGKRRKYSVFFSNQLGGQKVVKLYRQVSSFHLFKRTLHASVHDWRRKHALRTASLLSRNDAVFIFGPFFGGIHIIDKTGHQCAGLLNIKNLTSHNSGFMM